MGSSSLYTILVLCGLSTTSLGYIRMCYYAGWAEGRNDSQSMKVEEIDPHVCTHISYAFATIDPTGMFIEAAQGHDVAQYQRLVQLKHQNPGLKILLSLGGWEAGSAPFSKAVSSEANMQQFAHNAAYFLYGLGFDGLDIDWEYPAARGSPPGDKERFSRWLQILHETFNAPGTARKLILSVAVSPVAARTTNSYDVSALTKYADFINMMMYDFHGEWEDTVNVHSALYSNNEEIYLDNMARHWVSLGADKNKLVMGMPFYGRHYTLADPGKADVGAAHTGGGFVPYYEICQLVETHNVTEHILPTERVPYFAFQGEWYGYDNMQSLQEKAEYIRNNGYGGVMIWSIDMDDASGACNHGPYPLMHALIRGLSSGAAVIG